MFHRASCYCEFDVWQRCVGRRVAMATSLSIFAQVRVTIATAGGGGQGIFRHRVAIIYSEGGHCFVGYRKAIL